MITFLGYYVSEDLRTWDVRRRAERDAIAGGQDTPAVNRLMADWERANPKPRATIAQVADHIDHVRALIGVDHIGLGGDYDGTSSLPEGMQDVSTYPALIVELLRRGYSDDDVKKIIGLNVLRVMRDVETTAATLQASTEPSEALFIEADASD